MAGAAASGRAWARVAAEVRARPDASRCPGSGKRARIAGTPSGAKGYGCVPSAPGRGLDKGTGLVHHRPPTPPSMATPLGTARTDASRGSGAARNLPVATGEPRVPDTDSRTPRRGGNLTFVAILASLVLALTALPARAQFAPIDTTSLAPAEPSGPPTIRSITVEGNAFTDSTRILRTFEARPGQLFAADVMRRGQRSSSHSGLFSDVRLRQRTDKATNQVDLTIVVVKRPRIAKISFEGQKKREDADLEKKLFLKVGETYSPTATSNQVDTLKKYYQEEAANRPRYFVQLRIVRGRDRFPGRDPEFGRRRQQGSGRHTEQRRPAGLVGRRRDLAERRPIHNQSGGVFDIQTDVMMRLIGGTPTNRNAGRIVKSSGAGVTTLGVPLANTGTLEVQTGVISYAPGSVFNTGSSFTGAGKTGWPPTG